MPEIKHQFTGGKMNKDLDERLVPNGEYRDAMNIQVSTSEGSDVGTAQNILGNSLVPGQGFIGENSICVGSIADEKNDKLYYFVTQKELLKSNFEGRGTGWTASGDAGSWLFYGGGSALGVSGKSGYIEYIVPEIVEGNNYVITYDITKASTGSDPLFILANHTTTASTLNSDSGNNNVDLIGEQLIGRYSVEWLQGPANVGRIKLWNDDDFNGRVENVVVRQLPLDTIVEYDSKTNSVTPVFVDVDGAALRFDPNSHITGINIIDDLLFWTDNKSEPKKINIQRCISGTNSSGYTNTKLINKHQNIDEDTAVDMRESYITVIKKSPLSPLGLTLVDPERPSDLALTAIMSTNLTAVNSDFIGGTVGDWSSFSKDDVVEFEIPKDYQGASGFDLDWKVGDILAFKDAQNGLPTIPLTSWSMKAEILDWTGNVFSKDSGGLLRNGSFDLGQGDWGRTTPYEANVPFKTPIGQNIGFQSAPVTYGWKWRGSSQTMHFESRGLKPDGSYGHGAWHKLHISPTNHVFTEGRQYTLNFTISSTTRITGTGASRFPVCYINGCGMQGRIGARLFIGSKAYNFGYTAQLDPNDSTEAFSMQMTIGDSSLWKNTDGTPHLQSGYSNKIYFQTDGGQYCVGELDQVSLTWDNDEDAKVQVKILEISEDIATPANTNQNPLEFVVDRFDERGELFRDKFVRFSYRYKYQDNEYSTFAPFSEVAFSPGNFDYHAKKGHNKGMTNNLHEVHLAGFSGAVEEDVKSIDILAKVEDSPIIYIVDTVKRNDLTAFGAGNNKWELNNYIISSDTVKGAVPENQMLRPWDNVPKRALAQEVTGNRIIYGNYVQGHDLISSEGTPYVSDFNINVEAIDDPGNLFSRKSIKSQREYQLGVVFSDEYGRETPVISNESGSFFIEKEKADKKNILNVSFQSTEFPVNMKYFKFFIKENSNEYYNMAMDRYYDDEDGNKWLSFASNDINKIDLDTTLILKKGAESDLLVLEQASYKVLDVKNEAPDFIATSKLLIEEKNHVYNNSNAATNLFNDNVNDAPLEGYSAFEMNYAPFTSSSGDSLHEITDGELYIEFGVLGGTRKSDKYRINKISCDIGGIDDVATNAAVYSVKINGIFGSDVNFIVDSASSPTEVLDNTTVSIYKYVLDKKDSFEGRFFVKIFGDEAFDTSIKKKAIQAAQEYRVLKSQKLFFMKPNHLTNPMYKSASTGLDNGAYDTERVSIAHQDPSIIHQYPLLGDGLRSAKANQQGVVAVGDEGNETASDGWNNFSKFAVFFRNYKFAASTVSQDMYSGGGTPGNIGQYRFGNTNWKQEFLQYTSSGNTDWDTTAQSYSGWNSTYNASTNEYPTPDKTLIADARNEDDEVWFIDQGPYVSYRGTNDALHWQYTAFPSIARGNLGITTHADHWKMKLGSGPIASPIGAVPDSSRSNHFGLNNAAYQDQDTVDLVNGISPARTFRFKEDPTETIYTISPSVTRSRLIRYAGNRAYGWQLNHPLRTNTNATNTYNVPGSYMLQQHEIPELSPNFTNSFNLKITPQIEWNPATAVFGGITGGLELVVTSFATTPAVNFDPSPNFDNYHIKVVSISGNDQLGRGTFPITKGMILTSINNGAAPGKLLAVKKIVDVGGHFEIHLTGYEEILLAAHCFDINASQELVFEQPTMNGYTENATNRINTASSTFSIANPGLMAIGYTMEFVEPIITEATMPVNPAVFETQPKQTGSDRGIYYEASGLKPIALTASNLAQVIPIGSLLSSDTSGTSIYALAGANSYIPDLTFVQGYEDDGTIMLSKNILVATTTTPGVAPSKKLKITKPNGRVVFVTVLEALSQTVNAITGFNETNEIKLELNTLRSGAFLDWHNCYSFGNGVESNRIEDMFNKQYISNGVKASSTLDFDIEEQHRKYGLIFSGLYNSNSGTNNLNQFIQAELITKDINPTYGSIQKLHSRDSDLLAFCEDKVLKILANKDAIYNADGNPQLTANQNVLGQTIPFSGEFGISTNPESFASESYRVYFADRARGAILRLSKDGLTPISDHGMKDWFRDNLSLGTTNLLGENSLSAVGNWNIPQPVNGSGGGNSFVENGVATLGYFNDNVHDARYGRAAYLKMENVLEIGKKYRLQFDVIEHSGLTRESGSRSSITIDNSPTSGDWSGVSGMGNSRYDGAHVNVEWIASRTDLSLLQYQVNYRHDVDLNNDGDTDDSGEQNLTGYYDDGSGVQSIKDYVNALRLAAGLPDLFGPEQIQDPNFNEVPTLWVTLGVNDGYNEAVFSAGQCELTGLNRINTANDILLPSTDYVLEYEVTANSNPGNLEYWDGANFWNMSSAIGTHAVPFTTDTTLTSGLGTNFYLRHQGIFDSTDSITLGSVSLRVDGSDNIPDNNDYGWQSYLYGGTVTIKNLLLEEVKEDLKIVGSHDDRQNEYNVTIHGANSSTVSFKEDVRGWVSFKSFIPENAISCSNDYYTMLGGKLWQHHNPGTNRNTFYNTFNNSSINVLLNDGPGSVKSFHALDYEGSQSKIDLNASDNEYYNLTAKDGWYVSHIETDKQKGSLNEFIEKEGKWFNYIKGVGSDISMDTDFGAFDIQGVGVLAGISSSVLTFDSAVNSSLQIGDTIYQRQPNYYSGFTILNHNDIAKCGIVTGMTSNTITVGTIEAVPLVGDFILFAKNNVINTSSLLGYYADVKLENNSKVKAEIFSIGGEVTESSK